MALNPTASPPAAPSTPATPRRQQRGTQNSSGEAIELVTPSGAPSEIVDAINKANAVISQALDLLHFANGASKPNGQKLSSTAEDEQDLQKQLDNTTGEFGKYLQRTQDLLNKYKIKLTDLETGPVQNQAQIQIGAISAAVNRFNKDYATYDSSNVTLRQSVFSGIALVMHTTEDAIEAVLDEINVAALDIQEASLRQRIGQGRPQRRSMGDANGESPNPSPASTRGGGGQQQPQAPPPGGGSGASARPPANNGSGGGGSSGGRGGGLGNMLGRNMLNGGRNQNQQQQRDPNVRRIRTAQGKTQKELAATHKDLKEMRADLLKEMRQQQGTARGQQQGPTSGQAGPPVANNGNNGAPPPLPHGAQARSGTLDGRAVPFSDLTDRQASAFDQAVKGQNVDVPMHEVANPSLHNGLLAQSLDGRKHFLVDINNHYYEVLPGGNLHEFTAPPGTRYFEIDEAAPAAAGPLGPAYAKNLPDTPGLPFPGTGTGGGHAGGAGGGEPQSPAHAPQSPAQESPAHPWTANRSPQLATTNPWKQHQNLNPWNPWSNQRAA